MEMIGDKELVFEKTFVCSDNEAVSFDVNLRGNVVKFVITFLPGAPGAAATSNWTVTAQQITINFLGWTNSLGTVSARPDNIGLLGDQAIGMQIAHFRIGPRNLAHFAVLLGGTYG